MKKYLLSLLVVLSCSAGDLYNFKFSWKPMAGAKEYRVYSDENFLSAKKVPIAVTTNNWVTIMNMPTIPQTFYVRAVGTNGVESLKSRIVSYPKEAPEAPIGFDYVVYPNEVPAATNVVENDIPFEPTMSPTTGK